MPISNKQQLKTMVRQLPKLINGRHSDALVQRLEALSEASGNEFVSRLIRKDVIPHRDTIDDRIPWLYKVLLEKSGSSETCNYLAGELAEVAERIEDLEADIVHIKAKKTIPKIIVISSIVVAFLSLAGATAFGVYKTRENSSSDRRVQEARAQVTEYKKQNTGMDKEIASLKKQIEKEKEKIESTQQVAIENQKLKQENSVLKTKIEKEIDNLADNEVAVRSANRFAAENKRLKSQISSLRRENISLENTLQKEKEVTKSAEQAIAENQKLKEENNTLKNKNEELKERLSRCKNPGFLSLVGNSKC